MRRREFIALAGGAVIGARRLLADFAIASQDPLVTQYNLESLQGPYTPVDEFYVRNHNSMLKNSGNIALRIEGEVEVPQTLGIADLERLPPRRMAAVMECAGNGTGPYQMAGNTLWEGWPLEDVLNLARPRDSARYMHLEGSDGFVRSVPRARTNQDAMLVTRMGQQPLPPAHGAPWRVLFPGYYGMDSVKWLARITASGSALEPTSNDYLAARKAPDGTVEHLPLPGIQLKSAFVYPAVGAVLRIGRLDARGLTWSNGERIMAVEVSADGGKTWRVAKLDPGGSKYEWTSGQATLELAERGLVELACKAIDAQGREQPSERPPGRVDGYADNQIERIRVMVI